MPTLVAVLLVAAAPPETGRSHALDAVTACRSIADPTQRLACFDRTVSDLSVATEKRDVVVVDRQEVQEARHSLFGFNLPTLRIFGEGGGKGPVVEEEQQIDSTVRSARQDGDGNWIVTLDTGAVWHQTDGTDLAISPKPGTPVTVRRGSLGSYFMRIGKQTGVKARREG